MDGWSQLSRDYQTHLKLANIKVSSLLYNVPDLLYTALMSVQALFGVSVFTQCDAIQCLSLYFVIFHLLSCCCVQEEA